MTDHVQGLRPTAVTDPRFGRRITEAGPIALSIAATGVIASHAVDHFEGADAWWRFLIRTIGTSITESSGACGQAGPPFRMWRSIGHSPAEDGDRLNVAATLLLADHAGVPLIEATPVFGTVVLTGFDEHAWLPAPLGRSQRAAAAEAIAAAQHYTQMVVAAVNDHRND